MPSLNETRARQGLAPLDHVLDLFGQTDRVLLAISRAFDFAADDLPDNVRYIGPLLDPPGWSLAWSSPWTVPSDRARALITFSTGAQGQGDLAQRVITAKGRVAAQASCRPARM